MAFGRRKQDRDHGVAEEVVDEAVEESAGTGADEIPVVVSNVDLSVGADGPFDIEDFDDPEHATVARLDLGSVLIPMPPGGQIQVELNPMGVPSAIWVVTPNGRFTIAAYSAYTSGLPTSASTATANSVDTSTGVTLTAAETVNTLKLAPATTATSAVSTPLRRKACT